MSTPRPDQASLAPIVDATWLRDRLLDDPTITICYVGSTMAGRVAHSDFQDRHLPGARFVSLDDVLAAPPAGTAGRHPLPDPTDFARSMGLLGVADDATVVAYDDRGGAFAGRLVWMLRILGQRAALLDGGLDAWAHSSDLDADADVERRPASWHPVHRSVREWPLDQIADATDVQRHIDHSGVVIDSRDPDRYAANVEPIDAIAGHIPGAVNLVFTDNLDQAGRFVPPAVLHSRFAPIVGDDDQPIVYCGSGVTACHNALAMEHAGLGRPRVYVGSWSGWTADPDRPIATGAAP